MREGYVYHKQFVEIENINNIIDEVKKISNSQENYYFLRYSHQVSGICLELPSDRGEIEGQMFNAICELRWKKYKSCYEILILSKDKFELEGFDLLPGNWQIKDYQAYWNKQEPRFPKGLKFQGKNNQDIEPDKIPIHQRYFQDSDTATVHFVALTINQTLITDN